MPGMSDRNSIELYFGSLTDTVRKLAREIKYRSDGKQSLSGELRPALMELMQKYGVEVPSDK